MALLQPIQNSVAAVEPNHRSDDCHDGPRNNAGTIAQAVAGAISKWNLTMLFAIPGGLVLLVTVWTAFHPDLKGFSESLTATQSSRREPREEHAGSLRTSVQASTGGSLNLIGWVVLDQVATKQNP